VRYNINKHDLTANQRIYEKIVFLGWEIFLGLTPGADAIKKFTPRYKVGFL